MNKEVKTHSAGIALKRQGQQFWLLFLGIAMLLSGMVLLPVTACRQDLDLPPVIVSRATCEFSSLDGGFRHAGVSFRCRNTGTRQIVSLEVSFIVYADESGGNPLYGSNVVTAKIDAALQPDQLELFEISLDDRLAYLPDKPFVIDCFYVRKVTFDDGSEWNDAYGLYYAGSLPS